MGNCINKESSMEWGGDDWSDDYPDHLTGNSKKITNLYGRNYSYKKIQEEEEEDAGASTSDVYTEDMTQTTQVKLKITRKQLEELLRESTTNIKGVLSVEQVLGHLIDVTMHDHDLHSHQHHSWRPHLPTITEL